MRVLGGGAKSAIAFGLVAAATLGAAAFAVVVSACGSDFVDAAEATGDGGARPDASLVDGANPGDDDRDGGVTPSDAEATDGQMIIGVAAAFFFQCALRANGNVSCWGDDSIGELGNGAVSAPTSTPQLVHLPAKAVAIAGSEQTACALLSDQTVACWGNNQYGQLTLPVDASTNGTPVRITTDGGVLQGALEVVAGNGIACARRAADTVCWGLDSQDDTGQLGNGVVQGVLPVADLGASDETAVLQGYSCAASGGHAVCWGVGTAASIVTLADGGSPGEVAQIGVGVESACLRTTAGAVWCWGVANYGQLGTGSTANTVRPTAPAIASGAVDLAVGYSHSCAVLDGGAVQCWGSDLFHEVGASRTAGPACPSGICVPAPATKTLPVPATRVFASQGGSTILGADGNVYTWGLGNLLQLSATASDTCMFGTTPVACAFDPIQVNGIY